MNKESIRQLLNRFTSSDEYRTNMQRPFSVKLEIGDYLCATDSQFIVLVPDKHKGLVKNIEGVVYPDINRILHDFSKPIFMDFKTLKKLFDDVPIIERFVSYDCEVCEGNGSFNHVGDMYDCKSCKGLGKIESSSRKESIKSPKTAFKLNNVYITIEKMERLFEVCSFVSANPKLKLLYLGYGMVYFGIDDDGVIFGTTTVSEVNDCVEIDINGLIVF